MGVLFDMGVGNTATGNTATGSDLPLIRVASLHWVEHTQFVLSRATVPREGGLNVRLLDATMRLTKISSKQVEAFVSVVDRALAIDPRLRLPSPQDSDAWYSTASIALTTPSTVSIPNMNAIRYHDIAVGKARTWHSSRFRPRLHIRRFRAATPLGDGRGDGRGGRYGDGDGRDDDQGHSETDGEGANDRGASHGRSHDQGNYFWPIASRSFLLTRGDDVICTSAHAPEVGLQHWYEACRLARRFSDVFTELKKPPKPLRVTGISW